jgi:hypothetical protein
MAQDSIFRWVHAWIRNYSIHGGEWKQMGVIRIKFVTISFIGVFNKKKEKTMMRSRNIVLTAFLSSMITVVLIVAVFFGVSTTLANNASQEEDPQPDTGSGVLSPEWPEDLEGPEEVLDSAYLHIAGAAFIPWYDDSGSTYTSAGCRYTTNATLSHRTLVYALPLPSNATITSFGYYSYDNSASDATLYLRQYDDGETTTTLAQLTSIGQDVDFDFQKMSVDITLEYLYSYAVVWEPHTAGTELRLCAFRVFYSVPGVFGSALPLIKK